MEILIAEFSCCQWRIPRQTVEDNVRHRTFFIWQINRVYFLMIEVLNHFWILRESMINLRHPLNWIGCKSSLYCRDLEAEMTLLKHLSFTSYNELIINIKIMRTMTQQLLHQVNTSDKQFHWKWVLFACSTIKYSNSCFSSFRILTERLKYFYKTQEIIFLTINMTRLQ